MSENLYFNEDFYRRLAHLFYAFAAADRHIVIEEKRRIVTDVECYWDFHTTTFDSKEIIFKTMRKIIVGELDKDLAFASFAEFYKDNKDAFSTETKIKIKDSANAIIRSFAGANKSELTMLSQLHLLFQD